MERNAEISILNGMLDACMAGRGGVALISGPAASGKTALLRAFGTRVVAAGALFLQATGSGAERDLPLGVMEQLLLGADLPGADVELAAGLQDPEAAATPVRRDEGALPAAVANVLAGLCGILLAKAREKPMVLCIDEVQHVDAYSLECVLYLARRIEAGRILVVLGESSSFLSENPRFRVELLRLPGCRHMRLGLLSRRGVTEMITARRSGRRARSLAPDLHRLSGGNPLLMCALLEDCRAGRATAGAGPATGPDGTAEPDETDGRPVPGPAFEQAVTTCLYRGDVAIRHTAWALAVLGPHASRAALAAVLETTAEEAHRSLHALNETGLLSADRFRHEAGRTAVLRSMDPAYRTRLEARVARVLHEHGEPATVLVRHLIAADPIDAPWTLPTLLEAAERALADDEVALALDCLRAARDSCPDERQALSIRVALIQAGWRVNPAAGYGHLPELTAAARAGRLGMRDTRTLIGHLLWFGQVDQALAVLDAAAGPGAGEPGPESLRGPVTRAGKPHGPRKPQRFDSVRQSTPLGLAGPPGVIDALRRLLPAARGTEQGALALLATVLDPTGNDDGDSGGESVVVRAERALQGARLDDRSLTEILAALSSLVLTDELDKAAFWCDALRQEAAERHAPMWQSLFALLKALVEFRRGALAAAADSARAALTLIAPEGWGVAVASPVAALLRAETALGRLDHAAAQLSVPIPDAARHTSGGPLYLWARGHHHLAAGRPHAALDDFLVCGELTAACGLDLPEFIPWRSDAARVCLSLGDERRARSLAEEQLTRLRAGGSWARGVTLRVLAATAEPQDRPRLLGEAMEIHGERGHRFELARATEELARAHHELGDGSRARRLARTAQRLMRECGIEPSAHDVPPPVHETSSADTDTDTDTGTDTDTDAYADIGVGTGTAEEGTRQRSASERPWPLSGTRPHVIDELSDAELRVATLAARGHTNRQIAAKLFITVSTVEQHLTRVYRKLDVRRRTDLAPMYGLGARGPQGPAGSRGGTARGHLRAG
ncbi:helix-turn-helix transcriptional regulator [Streptomyces jumonjinensis]|nr:helix-turn-helix transcriptional regulator [Streptomyces jumonjinensis]